MSFVKEYSIGTKTRRSKEELKAAEDKRQKAREEDGRMVTGTFKNLEVKGGDLEFSFRLYKEEPYRSYHFEDGKTYTVPYGVAKHIKEMTKVKKHAYLVDKEGRKVVGVGSHDQRFEFIPTEFK